jgi:subtilisin family serine protease
MSAENGPFGSCEFLDKLVERLLDQKVRVDPATGKEVALRLVTNDQGDEYRNKSSWFVPGSLRVDTSDAERTVEALKELGIEITGETPRRELGLVEITVAVDDTTEVAARLAALAEPIRSSPHFALFGHWVARGREGDEPAPIEPVKPRREDGGKGTRVVVIDTGIDEWAAKADPFLHGVTFGPEDIDQLSFYDQPPMLDVMAGHGTAVAAIIRQIAPAAEVRMIRALDTDGVGVEDWIVRAIAEAVSCEPDVINLSFGGYSADNLPPLTLSRAIARVPENVALVAAAGNDATDRPLWPAAECRVTAVAALASTGDNDGPVTAALAPWSNRAFWVDCSAPGTWDTGFVRGEENDVVALFEPPDTPFRYDGWAEIAGTSMAAAAVTGAIAVAKSADPGSTGREAARRVVHGPGSRPTTGGGRAIDPWAVA